MAITVPYSSELFDEDDTIVALCTELNVSSFGESVDEALDSLKEAVTLFLEECSKMGTLDIVLEEAGYRKDSQNPGHWILREPVQTRRLEAVIA